MILSPSMHKYIAGFPRLNPAVNYKVVSMPRYSIVNAAWTETDQGEYEDLLVAPPSRSPEFGIALRCKIPELKAVRKNIKIAREAKAKKV